MLVNSLKFVSTKAKSPFHVVVGVIEQCGVIVAKVRRVGFWP